MVTATAPKNTQQTAGVQSPQRDLRVMQALGRKLDANDPGIAKAAASQLLSELFFGPLLAEARKFQFGREFLDGGQTESIFGEQLDQRVADSVAASDTGLVDQIAARLTHDKQSPPATKTQADWPTRMQIQDSLAGDRS